MSVSASHRTCHMGWKGKFGFFMSNCLLILPSDVETQEQGLGELNRVTSCKMTLSLPGLAIDIAKATSVSVEMFGRCFLHDIWTNKSVDPFRQQQGDCHLGCYKTESICTGRISFVCGLRGQQLVNAWYSTCFYTLATWSRDLMTFFWQLANKGVSAAPEHLLLLGLELSPVDSPCTCSCFVNSTSWVYDFLHKSTMITQTYSLCDIYRNEQILEQIWPPLKAVKPCFLLTHVGSLLSCRVFLLQLMRMWDGRVVIWGECWGAGGQG